MSRSAPLLTAAALALLAAGCGTPAPAAPPAPPPAVRALLPTGEASPLIADGVLIRADQTIYQGSGVGPTKLNPAAPDGSPESYLDPEQFPDGPTPGVTLTEAQAMNALARLREGLETHGLSLRDVTGMRVYLDKPPGADRADYAGWNRAYRQFFANTDPADGDTQPQSVGTSAPAAPQLRNPTRPIRSTVEVQSLAAPGWLVEIEVEAVLPSGRGPG